MGWHLQTFKLNLTSTVVEGDAEGLGALGVEVDRPHFWHSATLAKMTWVDGASEDHVENRWVMKPIGSSLSTHERLGATFAALADPTRRAILARLAVGEATVTELAAPFDMSQPAVSKHLKVLERAGLISRGRDAQRRPCRLEPRPLKDATDWLENYRRLWEERYRALDVLLDELTTEEQQQQERRREGQRGP